MTSCIGRCWNRYTNLLQEECGISEKTATVVAVASCLTSVVAGTFVFVGTAAAVPALINRSLCSSMGATWNSQGCDSTAEILVGAAIGIVFGGITSTVTTVAVPAFTAGCAKLVGCSRRRQYTSLD